MAANDRDMAMTVAVDTFSPRKACTEIAIVNG